MNNTMSIYSLPRLLFRLSWDTTQLKLCPRNKLRYRLVKAIPERFHRFGRLPIELRIMVWKITYANKPGRVVTVFECEAIFDQPRYIQLNKGRQSGKRLAAKKQSPCFFLVNSDARDAVMSSFKPLFPGVLSCKQIMFDWEKDFLRIESLQVLWSLAKGSTRSVEYSLSTHSQPASRSLDRRAIHH